MKKVNLGRSGIVANNVGLELGALISKNFDECREIVEKAVAAGIDFYDIGLPEEELQKRIGHATVGMRSQIVLAGSFSPCEPKEFKSKLQTVLRALKTDYLDLCQIHDPDYLPRTGDAEGFYDALTQAKEAGYIRSIGLTTGTDFIAMDGLEFGWYDTLQYIWNRNSSEEDLDLIPFAHEAMMGTISVPPSEFPTTEEELKKDLEWLHSVDEHLALWGVDGQDLDALLKALN